MKPFLTALASLGALTLSACGNSGVSPTAELDAQLANTINACPIMGSGESNMDSSQWQTRNCGDNGGPVTLIFNDNRVNIDSPYEISVGDNAINNGTFGHSMPARLITKKPPTRKPVN